MKRSIKQQIIIAFVLIVAGTILLCFILNKFFLEEYYVKNKQHILKSSYENINKASSEGNIESLDFKEKLNRVCAIYNISVIVIDANSKEIQSAGNNKEFMIKDLLDRVFISDVNNFTVIENNDKYVMQISHGKRDGMSYVEMWGNLDNGNLFMTRTTLESIHDSVDISNRFLAYVGIFAICISSLIIWIISKRITEPILSLSNISKRMAKLDFEARYTGKEQNEIGILGKYMNQLSNKLETTISELKTANNELKKDIQKKEEIDMIRKEFLSNVSHELKTPIAIIMGYAEGLKDVINDEEISKELYCDIIIDESKKMNIIVQKLLTLNQLENGNLIITFQRFNITNLIKEYFKTIFILLQQNNIKVEYENDRDYFVWANAEKIGEVIANYVSNAMNHIKEPNLVVVKFRVNESQIRVIIYNSGNKIPEEALPHLFEKFYKVDRARTREYGGNGVGLSIVKAIMDLHHQQYGVANKHDGVEFWFDLEMK